MARAGAFKSSSVSASMVRQSDLIFEFPFLQTILKRWALSMLAIDSMGVQNTLGDADSRNKSRRLARLRQKKQPTPSVQAGATKGNIQLRIFRQSRMQRFFTSELRYPRLTLLSRTTFPKICLLGTSVAPHPKHDLLPVGI